MSIISGSIVMAAVVARAGITAPAVPAFVRSSAIGEAKNPRPPGEER